MSHSKPPFPENHDTIISSPEFSFSTTYTISPTPINTFRSLCSAEPSLFCTVSANVSSKMLLIAAPLVCKAARAHPLWPNILWPACRPPLTTSELTPKCLSSTSHLTCLSANVHCSMPLHKLDSPGSRPHLMSPLCSPWLPVLSKPEC